jgi:DNA-directed RNA polymerase II subunit RPB2
VIVTLQRMNEGKEVNIPASIRSRTLTRCIRSAIATGNWGTQPGAPPAKCGVSQVLNRLTYCSSLSHLRRCNTPLGREGKQAKPRQLHNTQWGMICPCESPEGGTIGLIKNLALMAFISVGKDVKEVLHSLNDWGMMALEEVSPARCVYCCCGFLFMVSAPSCALVVSPQYCRTNQSVCERQLGRCCSEL